MPERAQVTSVEAIESFRSSLIVYLSKARPTLEEVSSDVLHARLWLQNDQRARWEHEVKVRGRDLERAQAELFGAMLSKIQTVTAVQQIAVTKARQSVREAEAKLEVIKKWDRELEHRTEPLIKLVDHLHGFLTSEMVRAVGHLAQVIKTLDAYARADAPGASSGPARPGDPINAGAGAGEQPADPQSGAAGEGETLA